VEEARTMVKMAIGMVVILAPLQLAIGDAHGLNTLEHQPTKIAAIEAHWDSSKPAAFELFAWPDISNEENRFSIAIPGLASLLLTHTPTGLFPGLLDVPPEDRPPVALVFFAFRIMVGIGLVMIGLALWGAFLWWRGKLIASRWYWRLTAH